MKTRAKGKEGKEYLDYRIGWAKRTFDLLFSSLALVFFSPVILLIIIAIKLESKGPVIYSQRRAGTGYDIFTFYKFRTMVFDADKKLSGLSSLNEYLKEEQKEYSLNNVSFRTKDCFDCKRLGKPCSPILFINGFHLRHL